MGDTYRPNRAPRDHVPAPLADRMTFSSGGGNNYRPKDRSQNSGRNANNAEFTFSNGHQAPQFPPSGPANSDHRPRRQQRGRGGRDGRRGGDYAPSYAGPRNNAYTSHRGRGPYKKPAPHERALLQTRDDTIEQPLGVSDGPNKFRNMEDMSDDEEADMDFDSDTPNGDAADNGKHKMARKQSSSAADGNSVPKWSNPELYSALPPPDETTGKRLDVVKLIRKAKIEAAEKTDASNAVAANDDFISFGDDGDNRGQPIVLFDDEPLGGGQSYAGSLNDALTSGALSAPNRNAKRSAEHAGLPQRPQHSDRSHKRKRATQLAALVEEWQSVPGKPQAPWAMDRDYMRLKTEPNKW
jgi:non-canonical poly(A) RNA polymerase PAPD5/7